MDIEITPEPASLGISPFPASWGLRVLYVLFVTVLPAFSFWATELLKPEWQSGKFADYIIVFLFPKASLLFFVLLAYSIVSYVLLLISPDQKSQSFFIRLGIYTGVLLALQYSIILFLYFVNSSTPFWILFSWILPPVYSRLSVWVKSKWDLRKLRLVLAILLVAAYIVAGIINISYLMAPWFFLLFTLTAAAPFWSLLLAGQAAIWLLKNHETKFTLYRGLGLAAWITVYIAAWRFNILKMYELYAALPPQPPPDCYIATAAANGHPQFVRSKTVQRVDGKSMQVNKQLQLLKCAELALLAIYPCAHKILRKIYDVAGKYLARKIRNPFVADIAYLLLKPCEWLAGFVLRLILPDIDLISSEMYK